jgi:indole-3-glycerol phosphate synthase
MTISTGTYLDRILVRTVEDLATRKAQVSMSELETRIASIPSAVPFASRMEQACVSVIAEFKRASPSKGRFPVEVTPEEVATDYVAGGVRGISCLTDEPFFQGSLDDLERVVSIAHAAEPAVGVLRKDFMIDPYQIVEARAHGADCILLIVAALDDTQLREYRTTAEELGMSVLVEVHDEEERERALASGATLIGVNNRDLRSFSVDLATTERIAAGMPRGITLVAESGIFTAEDVARMARAGASAVLVGEALIVGADRQREVRELATVTR